MDAEAFLDGMHRELARRKHELTQLKLALDSRSSVSAGGERWIGRAAVALAYAHWEGFVKSSGQRYLKHVNNLNLVTQALKPGLQVLAVIAHFRQATDSRRPRYLAELLVAMDRKRQQVFAVNALKTFETEGNLTSTVYGDLLSCLGLDRSNLDVTRAGFIDAKIVFSRNQVAHGELVEFTYDEAVERLDGVVLLIDDFSDLLAEAVTQQYYFEVPGATS